MTLYKKIIQIYPSLTAEDFAPVFGFIGLRNDSDGKGDYIEKWEHPIFPRPTAPTEQWSS